MNVKIHWTVVYLLIGVNCGAITFAMCKLITKPTLAEQAFNSCVNQKISEYMCYLSMRNPVTINESLVRRKK